MTDVLSPTGQAALAYVEQGWRVLPLHTVNRDGGCSCGNSHCRSAGKHPVGHLVPNGLHDAAADHETVRQWWNEFPKANVGIATGEASGLAIIDVDPEDGGDAVIQQLQAEHEALPETLTTLSGGGGWHLWFAHPGQQIHNIRLGTGVDMRGDSGCVVAPPSVHESGQCYGFEGTDWRSSLPLPDLPDWVIAKANQPKAVGKSQKSTSAPTSSSSETQQLSNELWYSYQSRMNPRVHSMIRDDKQFDHHPSPSERDFRVIIHLRQIGLEEVEVKKVFYNQPIGRTLPSRHAGDVEGYLERSIRSAHPLNVILNYHLRPTYQILKELHEQDRRRVNIKLSRRDLKSKLQERGRIDEQTFRTLLRFLEQIGVRQASSGKTARYHLRKLEAFLERLEHEDVDELVDEYGIDL